MQVVRNRTSVEQFVLVEGKRYTLLPHSIDVFDEKVCRRFLEEREGCELTSAMNEVSDNVTPGEEKVWLYNTSGNPDAPSLVDTLAVKDKQRVTIQIPNPLLRPLVITRTMGGAQVIRNNESLNFPGRTLSIAPYTRKAFNVTDAQFIMRRDQGQAPEMRGAIAYARTPNGKEEPNTSWEYEDLRLYAGLVDRDAFRNLPTLNGLKHQAAQLRGQGVTNAEVIERAKAELFRRLWFRVVNPIYPLPKMEEFWAYKEQNIVQVSSDVQEAIANA
jgi:hypothetical protein